jgi:methanogenic corrinoid protein MtbC1
MKSPTAPHDDVSVRHPIAVVSDRTGLSQDVLRVWERRYQAVEPTRGPGGHRTYSDADIARLRLLHVVTSAGRSIGQVARLSTEELSRLAQEDAIARAQRRSDLGSDGDTARGSSADTIVDHAIALAGKLDSPELEHVLRRAVAQFGVTAFIEEVASPILRRVGDDWHAGRLTIAHEHLASSTIHDIVAEAMRSMARRGGAATVVVATPAGERHAIGAALIGAAAATEGWRVLYLGPDLPANDIATAAVASNARAVALSSVYVSDRERTLSELRALRALLPPAVVLVVGGSGSAAIADDLAGTKIRVGESLADLRAALADAAPDLAAASVA